MFGCHRLHHGFNHFHMQILSTKTTPMQLSASPAWLEGFSQNQIKHLSEPFHEKQCSPRRACKTIPQNEAKSTNVWLASIAQWCQPFPHANAMPKTPQMPLHTSPTCFEGTRGRKIGFRDPAGTGQIKNYPTKTTH